MGRQKMLRGVLEIDVIVALVLNIGSLKLRCKNFVLFCSGFSSSFCFELRGCFGDLLGFLKTNTAQFSNSLRDRKSLPPRRGGRENANIPVSA
jgi:hypothetical protein